MSMPSGAGDQPHRVPPHRPLTQHGPADLPAEFAALLRQIDPDDAGFGHRQHVQLAFLTARRYGTAGAVQRITGWIAHLTARQNVPQKYNATMTRAWTEIVGHHLQADPSVASFAEFAARNPQLLDKRLLGRHYSPAVLASPAARSGWVEPDLAAFPWS
jgi:hypothetical protein